MSLMIVTDSWTKDKDGEVGPLNGPTYYLLKACLSQVGIAIGECDKAVVFDFYSPGGLKNLCGPKTEGIPGWPALIKGKFVNAKYTSELDRLFTEIQNVNPTLILAMGYAAVWALCKTTSVKSIRGAPVPFTWGGSRVFKVLPTYGADSIIREWKLRPILLSDLQKAREQMDFPQLIRPSREIWIEPTLADLDTFEREHILPSPQLSIDIETSGDQITCIGFAPRKDIALVVPFTDSENSTHSYWSTLTEELKALEWVRRMCSLKKSIIGQNFLYDLNHLWTKYGITVPHASEDTMLLHHALQPEMQKGLGFLGSIYTDEPPWKVMRKAETIKRED